MLGVLSCNLPDAPRPDLPHAPSVRRAPARSALGLGQPALLVQRAFPALEAPVRLGRVGRLHLHRGAVLLGDLRSGVDETLATAAARAHSQDDRGLAAGADDDVLRPGRAVEEVPGLQLPLLALDDQQTLAGQYEEVLLGILAVIQAHRRPGPEHVQVDPEARETPLALEVAERADRTRVAPAAVPCVHHEPALASRAEAELRAVERRFGCHDP